MADAAMTVSVEAANAKSDSATVQAAIDQLTYLQRILHGDETMSLNDLLASTSASGPSSSLPPGGLSRALSALLHPLIPERSSHTILPDHSQNFQQSTMGKGAAFEPRQYIAMTSELFARMSNTPGDMHRAIELAQRIMAMSQPTRLEDKHRHSILADRRQRKTAAQQILDADRDSTQQDKDTFTSIRPYLYPTRLTGKAKEEEPKLSGTLEESMVKRFLLAWKLELCSMDPLASEQIQVVEQQWRTRSGSSSCVIRMHVRQAGFAWLWVHFDPADSEQWVARVEQVNIRAESEIVEPSLFPLYRRLTTTLCDKLIELTLSTAGSWENLILGLFALASLCRLHDLQPPQFGLQPSSAVALRGQESILHAWSNMGLSSTAEFVSA